MFEPKYTINNLVLKYVSSAEVSKEVIVTAPLIPAWEAKFRKEAIEQTIFHGTHLEGNRLSEEDVVALLEGKDVNGRERDVQEVMNYRNVLKFIDLIATQIGPGNPYLLTNETILELHRLTTEKILDESNSGQFRKSQVVIKNSKTGEITYTPPPAAEIPYLMEDLIGWINADSGHDTNPLVKAGIVHYEIARIHPFIDANGRLARAVAMLLMALDGYDIRKFLSLEPYFDSNPFEYYSILQTVSNQNVIDSTERDLTPWLEYYCKGLGLELMKIKDRVKRISADSFVKDRLGQQLELNERQMSIMDYLHRHGSLQNKDFRKIFPDFSDDTVLREIKFLKSKNLIKKVGTTKKAAYTIN